MKISPRSSLFSLLTFSTLYTPTLAALAIVQPPTLNLAAPNITAGPYSTPPDPYQLRIPNTRTTLILGKYTLPPPNPAVLLAILAKAEFEVVKGVVQARGDAPVAQPTFEWRHGRTYVRLEQHALELKWLTLAEALYGVVLFGYDFDAFVGCAFTVLDDEVGVVARGSVGLGYT